MTTNTCQNYTFWTLLDTYTLEIPIIQRDYAQGRTDQRTLQIRNDFLNALHDSLENNKAINLDFIYGSLNADNKLILLDGQQRLTTLFLLHWYLINACHANYDSKHIEKLKKFSYHTRISSRLFCAALCKNLLSTQQPQPINAKISAQIKDAPWFFRSWTKDPTIAAMLEMLDAIQEKFDHNNLENYWQALTNQSQAIISFQFLDMKEFKLTDDLYVKMNARGKALTDFENFKAWLEKHVEGRQLPTNWTEKLDTTWADLFWHLDSKQSEITNGFDNAYLNFFKGLGLFTYLEDFKLPAKKQALEEPDDSLVKLLHSGEGYVPVADYERVACFNTISLSNMFKALDAFSALPNVENGQLKEILKDFIGSPSYWQRAQFYAVYQFIVHTQNTLQETDIDFQRWLRVCNNLTNNTRINNSYDFTRVIKDIKKLAKKVFTSDDATIFAYLQQIEKLELDFLSGTQQKEEVLKAKLIKVNADWEDAIVNIENHDYFYGQIGFILKFACINDTHDLSRFIQYAEKLALLFTDYYLGGKSQFVFQRALLCKGNYLIYSGYNHDFCSPNHNSLRDLDDNWRKVFRDKEGEQRRRSYLKNLLDDVSINDMTNSLEQIIQTSPAKKDWTEYFIQCPQAIARCTNHQIRVDYDGANIKTIFLLSKERMSSTHSELRSVCFYEKHLKTLSNITPFTKHNYETVAGSSYDPYAYLDGWQYQGAKLYLSVTCNHHDKNQFTLWLTDDSESALIPQDVQAILRLFEFLPSEDDTSSMERELVDEVNVLAMIKKLLPEFNTLAQGVTA